MTSWGMISAAIKVTRPEEPSVSAGLLGDTIGAEVVPIEDAMAQEAVSADKTLVEEASTDVPAVAEEEVEKE